MIPKLHKKGHSFRGIATYVLHDKGGASTSERVAWVETRNLATQNPQVAWRVMAATAQNQEHLKAQAGIKNTGRKSDAHVLHLTLSWSADEAHTLTREEMMRAANGALHALSASDRQAMIVAHDDQEHPHVHVVINRVSADDGRILNSSKDRLHLSKWAQKYEQERGYILCPERVVNNAARDRGEYARAEERSRLRYEREKQVGRDPARLAKLAELAKRGRENVKQQIAASRKLEREHKEREKEIRLRAQQSVSAQRQVVRDRYRDRWRDLFQSQHTEKLRHLRNEGRLVGRAKNTLKAIDFQSLMKGAERRTALGRAFQVIGSSGARIEELKRKQTVQQAELLRRQRREEQQAAIRVRQERQRLLVENQHRYLAQRSSLQLTNRMNDAALRAAWRQRGRSAANEKVGTRRPAPTVLIERPEQPKRSVPVNPATATTAPQSTKRVRAVRVDRPTQPARPTPEQDQATATRPTIKPVFERAATHQPEPTKNSGEDEREKRLKAFQERKRQQRAERSNDNDRGNER